MNAGEMKPSAYIEKWADFEDDQLVWDVEEGSGRVYMPLYSGKPFVEGEPTSELKWDARMSIEDIDTSGTEGKIKVMTMATQGHAIVCRDFASGEDWRVTGNLDWAWSKYDYAVVAEQPGPREAYFCVDSAGRIHGQVEDGLCSKGYVAVRYVRGDV